MLTSLILGTVLMADRDVSGYAIIPIPVFLKAKAGDFIVKATTKVFAGNGAKSEAQYLADQFGGLRVIPTHADSPIAGSFLLTLEGADPVLGDEGYELRVTPQSVTLRANRPAGLFHGVQTMRQLVPLMAADFWTLSAVYVRDYPRFKWRGMHLDVGRHMFPVEAIKRYLDTMAFFKMNTFHWHLTEDQGWRIDIKKYPKLAEISSVRKETFGRPGQPFGDGAEYGGYYTQDQIREVVAYAARRHITVVPEIEMPGHSSEVLAAYPNLACDTPTHREALTRGENPFEVSTTWGVKPDILCAGREETFEFLQDVLDEVLDLFPGTFIHIGGDEAPKARWEQCTRCQRRIKDEGLADEHELQSYFIQRIDKYLTGKGRRLIGWDEILEGGLAENAAVMSWRGTSGGIAAAEAGHDAVMTPTSHCYLDYYQSRLPGEPEAIGGFIDLAKAYSYEPIPEGLAPDKRRHILGVQGNVWTEYMKDAQQVEYMAWPRGAALAEVGWTPPALKDFDDFSRRWNTVQYWVRSMGVNYFTPRELRHAMPARIRTTLGTLGDNHPVCAFDGDINSQFVSEGGVKAGDTFTVELVEPMTVRRVSVRFGPIRGALRGGAVEISEDGQTWHPLGEFKGAHIDTKFAPRSVKAVRLRLTKDSKYRLIIREIEIG
ncbi:MAG: family 20 glycosylhydrolase [Armatimonadetes bacterium]|nr:family 20 glycosylhydrolase [Armatimonadota bacterium]